MPLDATVKSWIPSDKDGLFSIHNLPFGIASIKNLDDAKPHVVTRIGGQLLSLARLSVWPAAAEALPSVRSREHIFLQPHLNALAALGRGEHAALRGDLQRVLRDDTDLASVLRDDETARTHMLFPADAAEMLLPMQVGDYTDFYAGYHHAYNVGVLFRGAENALQPNYTHLPVGYHGRASSIVVSGTPIRRPKGQRLAGGAKEPSTGPSLKFDFELELGCFICKPNEMGESIGVDEADEHIFGYVLLNDWSARDIQAWEYVPLGPFNSKNFGTTISPWVVVPEALEPFRIQPLENKTPIQEYLKESRRENVYDIKLQVSLAS